MPSRYSAGTAKIAMAPDGTGLKQKFEAIAQAAVAGVVAHIRLEVDTAEARAEIESLPDNKRVKVEAYVDEVAQKRAEKQIREGFNRASTVTPTVDNNAARRAGRTAGEQVARGQAEGQARAAKRYGRREGLVLKELARYPRLNDTQKRLAEAMQSAARQVDHDNAAAGQAAALTGDAQRRYRQVKRLRFRADAVSGNTPELERLLQGAVKAARGTELERQLRDAYKSALGDDLKAVKNRTAGGGRNMRRSERARLVQQLQEALAYSENEGTVGALPGRSGRQLLTRLQRLLRETEARYNAAAATETSLRQKPQQSAARYRAARKAFQKSSPDPDPDGTEIRRIFARPASSSDRIREKAQSILRDRPLGSALEDDRRAIRNAARSAERLDNAERAVTKTRVAYEAATNAVNAAEAHHAELQRNSAATAEETARAERTVAALRARRVSTAEDYSSAMLRRDYSRKAFQRDEGTLDRRVNLPIARRMFEGIDQGTTKALSNFTEKLLLTGRLLTATSQVAAGTGFALAALGAVNLVPLVGSLLQAGSALAVLPALATGAAAGIAAIVVGSSGVVAAFKAASQLTKNSEADTKARESAAKRVQQAQRSVEDAYRSASRTAVQGQESVASAERSLERAQRTALDAQKSLNDARKAAALRIRDVNDALRGSATSEKQAYLATLRARQNLAEAFSSGDADGLDIAELQLAVTAADEDYEAVRRRNKQLREEATETNRAGIEGDEGVVNAKRSVTDAIEAQAEAQRDLQRTLRDTAEANADAQRGITEALEAQQEAFAAATENASSWERKYQEALKNLSPRAREFVEDLRAMGDSWRALRTQVQDSLFDGLGDEVQLLGDKQLPTLKDGLTGIATGINTGLRSAVRYLTTDLAQTNLEAFFTNTSRAAVLAGDAFAPLTQSLLNLSTTGSAFLPQILGGVTEVIEKFDDKIGKMRASGELAMMIDSGIEKSKQLGRVIKESFGVLQAVFRATSSQGDSMLDGLERRVTEFHQKLDSASGQNSLRAFFDGARDAWNDLYPILADVVKVIARDVIPAFQNVGGPILNLVGLLASMFAAVSELIPALEWLVTGVLAIKAFNAVSGIVTAISGGFFAASRNVDVFNNRVNGMATRSGALSRVQNTVSAIGGGLGRWSGIIAGVILTVGLLGSKASDVASKIQSTKDVFQGWATSVPDFRRDLTNALNEADGIADENVRAKMANRFREFQKGFEQLKNNEVSTFGVLMSALGAGLTFNSAGLKGTDWDYNAGGVEYGKNALTSLERLRLPVTDISDALVGTNAQFDALVAKVRATGTEGESLLPTLKYLRAEFNDSVRDASRMASAYDSIRKNSTGAADAVDKLTAAFEAQRRDATILEDAEQSANAALDSISELLSGNLVGDNGEPMWLASLIKANGEIDTLDNSGRQLRDSLKQLSTSFAEVGSAAYVSARDAGKSEAEAHAARIEAMQGLQDRLRQMLVDADVPKQKIDDLLASFRLIPEALADPLKVDLDTEPAKAKLNDLAEHAAKLATTDPAWFGDNADPYNTGFTANQRATLDKPSTPTEVLTDRVPSLDKSAPKIAAMSRDQMIDFRAQTLRALAKNPSPIEYSNLITELAAYNRALGVAPGYLGGIVSSRNQRTAPGTATPTTPGPQPNTPPATTDPATTPAPSTTPAPDAAAPAPTPAPGTDTPAEVAPAAAPDFTSSATNFSAFADTVSGAYDKQIAPALTGIADKTAAMASAIVDARKLAEPALTELGIAAAGLNITFTQQIAEGALVSFQKLRPAMGLDIADITLDMFPKLSTALEGLTNNFKTGVGAIWLHWSGVKRALAEPIKWVLENVINKGLRDAWNALRQVMPDLPEWTITVPTIEGYSSGGLIPGYRPGHDDRTIMVGPGEAIMRPEWVQAVGPGYVHAANRAARSGGIGGVRRYQDTLQRYATGGIVGTRDPLEPVQQSLWDAVRAAFPKAVLTSAKRFAPVGSGYDYHMQGRAIDLGGPMAEIARWIYGRYPQSTELIHWPLQGWQNLKNGRPLAYDQKTNDGHRDHLHWANLGKILSDGRMISMAAGSGTYLSGLQDQIQDLLVNPLMDLRGTFPDWGTSLLGGALPEAFGGRIIDAAIQSVQNSPLAGALPGAWNLSGGVQQWRGLVEKILKEKGQNLSETDRVLMQMQSESGGNPRAINLWDSNAKRGIPSKGLMQVIDPTFQAYKDAGYEDIWDPESNIRAAINYALRDPKYGSLAAAFQGKGYDQGGILPHGGIGYNTSGKPELVLTNEQMTKFAELIKALAKTAQLTVPDLDGADTTGLLQAAAEVIPQVQDVLRKLIAKVRQAQGDAPESGDTEPEPLPIDNADPPASDAVNPDDYTDTPVSDEDRYGPTSPSTPAAEQWMSPEQFVNTFGPKAGSIVGDFFQAQWDGVRSDLGLRDSGFLTKLAQNHNQLREGGNQVAKVIEQHVHYHVSNLDEAMRKEQLRQRQQAAGYIRR
ncbi:transglycosylase SLT domain-containing protein [Nocardia sp. NPDC050435]|uniref:transglycosylase SLT domain-containing protein n=1 Tax=Nocardia sp. NPDC050435 TaxID=3155040 RepID=UPI0033F78901